jgi:hypothetical protein
LSHKITHARYTKLLDDISAYYENARSALVKSYWQIGKRIVLEEQKGSQYAPYGEKLLERLSQDLLKKSGEGCSVRNLERMRNFYLAYPNSTAPSNLNWTQHVELLQVKDKNIRKSLVKRVIHEKLHSRDLRSIVQKVRGVISLKKNEDAPLVSAPQEKTNILPKLKEPKDVRLFTYSRAPKERVTLPEGYVGVDCGFSVYWIVKKNEAPRFTEKPSYTYSARVTNVVDGDTLRVSIDAGFGVIIDERIRLRGINASEVATSEGRAAKKKLEALMPEGQLVVIKTSGRDIYGRYLGDVWWSEEGEIEPENILSKGKYLNQYLVDIGVALVV